MSNLPPFGRSRQRPSRGRMLKYKPSPEPASPLKSSPTWLPSPAKKPTSPIPSPKYGSSLTRLPSPPPPKDQLSPPLSPANKYPHRWIAQTSPLQSPSRSLPTSPLPPLTLPPTQLTAVNGTTTQPRIQPSMVYNKTVEKPVKSDRPSEYGSGKPHEKQKAADSINLAGHNVGAVMEIDKSSVGHRLGGETVRKNETEGGDVGRDGNEEKKKEEKKKKEKKEKKEKKVPMTAFMNSNFQSVNNSVLYDSSCSHRDPGLHLKFADAADGDGAAVDGRKSYKA